MKQYLHLKGFSVSISMVSALLMSAVCYCLVMCTIKNEMKGSRTEGYVLFVTLLLWLSGGPSGYMGHSGWQERPEDECDVAGIFYRLPMCGHSHEMMTMLSTSKGQFFETNNWYSLYKTCFKTQSKEAIKVKLKQWSQQSNGLKNLLLSTYNTITSAQLPVLHLFTLPDNNDLNEFCYIMHANYVHKFNPLNFHRIIQ